MNYDDTPIINTYICTALGMVGEPSRSRHFLSWVHPLGRPQILERTHVSHHIWRRVLINPLVILVAEELAVVVERTSLSMKRRVATTPRPRPGRSLTICRPSQDCSRTSSAIFSTYDNTTSTTTLYTCITFVAVMKMTTDCHLNYKAHEFQ